MRIIPAIDLKGGMVVRAVGGRREEYRSVESPLFADSQPVTVSRAFVGKFGFAEAYIADLDALAGRPPDVASYASLLDAGLNLCIDAGIRDGDRLAEMADLAAREPRITGVIAGLETLPDLAFLQDICAAIGPKRVVFSLDLWAGRPWTKVPSLSKMSPADIASAAVETGVHRLLVLDVARVGTDQGSGASEICGVILSRCPGVSLFAGGGIRDLQEIHELASAGCQGAIVASSIYDGRLTTADIHKLTG